MSRYQRSEPAKGIIVAGLIQPLLYFSGQQHVANGDQVQAARLRRWYGSYYGRLIGGLRPITSTHDGLGQDNRERSANGFLKRRLDACHLSAKLHCSISVNQVR